MGPERDIAETALFLPLACRENVLLFGDIRYKADDRDNREGNIGAGARFLKAQGISGAYVYLDRRRSGLTEKLHSQMTIGAEWLTENWETRGNAYLPLTGEKIIGEGGGQALDDPFLAGSGIFVTVGGQKVVAEKSLAGLDAEAGFKLPGTDFWLHTGAFAFDGKGAEGLSGARGRATWNLTDNIALTAQAQHDNLRGRQGWIGVRFTVPFGGPAEKHEGLKARMTANPVRDVDIVTAAVQRQATPDTVQPILNAETGNAQRVIYVDNTAAGGGTGTKETPFNTLAAAQAVLQDHDVVYINRGDGTTTGMDAGIAIARDGVQLIGSGTAFVYDSDRFQSRTGDNFTGTILAAAGLAPVITNTNINGDGVRITGADALVGGITVDSATRHGIYALANGGTDLGSIAIHNVTVTDNGQSGVLIETNNVGSAYTTATARNITATGNVNRGVYALIQNGSSVETLEMDNINAQNNNGVTTGGIVVTSNGAGSLIENARITNSAASNNVTGGVIFQAANSGVIANVEASDITASGNAAQGILVQAQSDGDLGTATLEDITVQNNTGVSGTGLQILSIGIGSTITSATVDNALASGNAVFGLYATAATSGVLDNIEIENSTSSNNTSAGYEILAQSSGVINAATIADSTANANGSNGGYILALTGGDIGTATVERFTSQNNTGVNGRGLTIQAGGAGSTITTATVTDSLMSGNVQQGLWVQTQTDADIGAVAIDGLTSRDNGTAGLHALTTDNGTTLGGLTVANSLLEDNGTAGLYLQSTTFGSMTGVTIDDVTASGNAQEGFNFFALNNGVLSLRMQNATATANGTNGVYIDDDTPAAYTADLGGGALGGTGGNRIFGNTGTELRVDHDGANLMAEGNWWGHAAGLQPAELTLEGGSTVDAAPFLAADPGP